MVIGETDFINLNGDVSNTILDTISYHLYVCPSNSKELERHILSRNYLINNQKAKEYYQKIKYEHAEKANQDRKIYAYLKEQVLKDVFDFIVSEGRKKLRPNVSNQDIK